MIYLDNAATTRPDAECLEKAAKYLGEQFFNPSALYAGGYTIHREIARAREDILGLLTGSADFDLIFTSCGTEADNQALFGGAKRGNCVTTMGEHSAIFSAASELKERGIEVRFAGLNGDGSVNEDELLSLVDDKTSLVSVIHVNNETGAVNDINRLAAMIKGKNKRALFHSDGVQAFGKIPFKLSSDIDMYSVSAHKIGGVKGAGALIKRKSLPLKPFIYGGGQENGLRSGTENVFGIMMMALAAKKRYAAISESYENVSRIRQTLVNLLDKRLFKVISSENSSPYILAGSALGVRGEIIMHELDDRGLIVGTGSACSSNAKRRYSRVMLACGLTDNEADGVLRLSFSPENTETDAIIAANLLNETVSNRRAIME